MNKTHCPACGETISRSRSARRCPECGYVLKPNWKALIVGIIVILSLSIVLLAPYLLQNWHEKQELQPPSTDQVATMRS